jgi:2-pyrone-4,6-dicarboxylate lactonase
MNPLDTVPSSNGIWDCHTHIFGPYAAYPLPAGAVYSPPEAPFSALRSKHAALGVRHGVLVQGACYGDDHTVLLDALDESGGAYRGVALIGPDIDEARLVEMHARGVRGIRLNLMSHLAAQVDFGRMSAMIERIQPYGWHASIHGELSDVVQALDALADREVPLVIDHMARVRAAEGIRQEGFAELERFLSLPYIWIKLSGADRITESKGPYELAAPIARRLLEVAPDRAVWGTDWPHPNIRYPVPEEAGLLSWIRAICGDRETADAVLIHNPARLYA